MIGKSRLSNILVASLVVTALMSGCGGGGGGGSGNSVASTTSTLVSTESTTTTTDDATTTTTLGGGDLYDVTFDLDDAVTIGALQIEVDYAAAGGGFVGSAGAVSCSTALAGSGVLASFGDVDADSQLNFAAIAGGGLAGPVTLATCTFAASGPEPSPNDFVVTVVEATALGLVPIVPLPTVSVSVTLQ